MLNNIPPILSPELLKVLCEMGHGDRICIGDGNFPGVSMAKPNNCVFLRADGHGVPELLDAILQVIPLDEYVEHPVMIMQVAEKDKGLAVPIWDEYKKIVARHDARGAAAFGSYERFEFYDEARKTYCITCSGQTQPVPPVSTVPMTRSFTPWMSLASLSGRSETSGLSL